MQEVMKIHGMNEDVKDSGLVVLKKSSDGVFESGKNGVVSVTATGDRKVEFISFCHKTLAYVKSEMGYPSYYPSMTLSLRQALQ